MFGFDQELGGVVNQAPSLERPRNDPLTGGLSNLKPMTIVVILVVLFVVYKFVLKK